MLRVEHVSFAYPNKKVLNNINIELHNNEVVSIIGGSGVGKTTLFHLISGLLPLQSGKISVNGNEDYKSLISYMLQKDMLLEHKTILENIMLPLIIQKENKEEAKKEVLIILEEVNLKEVANLYPKQLSGGMRQRVAFLRTYMFKREILLLDEAFSALDAHTRVGMHKWYQSIHKKLNLSTILITHDIDEAIILSDRIYVLGNQPGEIILELKIENKQHFTYENVTDVEFNQYKKILLEAIG